MKAIKIAEEIDKIHWLSILAFRIGARLPAYAVLGS
jgi:hypothetical protein